MAAAAVGMAIGLVAAGGPAAVAVQPPAPPPTPSSMVNAVPAANTPSVDDGDVRAIAKVGSTMVMGGNFTSVNGQARSRVAVFNPSTGALSGFNLAFNGEVDSIVPGPTTDTAYVGGSFTQVGTAAIKNVALVNLTSGTVVSSFVTPGFGSWGNINDMVKVGNRLVVAGNFTVVGGRAHAGIAALNATTGAVDHTWMNIQFAGHHNNTGSGAQGPVGPWNLDVSPSGDRIVAIGNFRTADGLDRDQVAQITTTGATAVVTPDWQTNRYNPYCFNWAFDSYVRGVSYSPDGSYFVVAATGGGVANTLCDAAARFETYATGSDIQPTWVSETGGDTMWGTEITDNAVYVGGHQRWGNNPYGSDTPGPGAVPRPGLVALDPVSGRPLQWNPGRNPPGKAVYAVLATSEGLWIGSNTDYVGNFRYLRKKIALFPYAGGAQLAQTNVGALPGSVFMGGPVGGATSTNVLYRVNAGGGAIAAIDNGPDWADDSGSSPLHNDGSNAAGWGSGAAIDPSVPSSTPSSIFDSERWDPGDANEMRWTFPIAAGTDVQVRLYLANRCGCTSAVGSRVFSVSANGSPWLTNYDIVGDVGDQKGTMKSINLTVPASGQVTLDFTHVVENPLVNGIEIVRAGVPTPPPAASDTLSRVGLTATAASSAPEPAADGGIAWSNTRGAFMVGNKVFYAQTDGYLYSRTFTGTTWGPAVQINPYHDPAWATVDNHLGGTFDGNLPTLYGQIPNLTGMFYNAGRLYYTLYGDSRLFWRWFSPDSGIVDERTNVAPSSVDLRNVRGIFVAGDSVYFASRTDSTLYKAGWDGASVTGSPVAISGPAVDGTSWSSRSMFLFAGPPLNQAPKAAFGSSCSGATCGFDASASSDSDGTIASYAWDFGDGSTGSGKTPSHPYAASGTYSVKLTVTDDKRATGTLTKDVVVTVPVNQAPTAAFGSSCSGATCGFDASASSDSDGTIASYAWDFGDGSTGSGKTPSHPYAASGTYSVKLTVTDDKGATGTLTKDVVVTVPVNQAPTAAFGSSCSGATCGFDASASSDSDGTIASYAWDFGDGSTGSGKTPSHPYAPSGTYSVKLTVTDDKGATGTLTKDVVVTVPSSSTTFVGANHSAPGAAKFKAAAVPTGTQAGDLMLLMFSRPTVATFSGPTGVTGWTQVATVTNGSVTSTVWRKSADAADVGKTVRFDDPSTYRLGTLDLAVYRGADATSVRAVSAVDVGQSSHTTPAIAVSAGDWVVSHWAGLTSAVSPWTLPSGMVVRDHLEDPSGAYRYESLTADPGAVVTSGGTSAGVTATTVNKSDREVMWSIAFGQS
ncbi:PKD domain-containing protein [Terrabacter sp. NPDC000476]|uniref:PKD domain-containing protein n=1 Tax=Terrabacter sp. NPDC000476 TaxID=3154258 RepID=UPI00332D1E4E